MNQPEGIMLEENPQIVCKLKKSLYGLKQSPRQWNKKINQFFCEFGFIQNSFDPCVYYLCRENAEMIVGVYVDDLVIASSNLPLMNELKKALHAEFEMKDLGELKFLLGMEVDILPGEIRLSQHKYLQNVLEKFGMFNATRVSTPMEPRTALSDNDELLPANVPYREVIGSLNYLMTCTRPDIATSLSMVARFLNAPTRQHWKCVKRILRYLVGTKHVGIRFVHVGNLKLTAFSDSDWAGDEYHRKSRTGFVVLLGGGPINWTSRLQDTIALSSTEAEYIAMTETAQDLIWLQYLLESLDCESSSTIYVDNLSAIDLANNPIFNRRTKHIEVKFHKIREWVNLRRFDICHVDTNLNDADLFTKNLPVKSFSEAMQRMNIVDVTKVEGLLSECESCESYTDIRDAFYYLLDELERDDSEGQSGTSYQEGVLENMI